MTTKPNPFLAGMRATGSNEMNYEDRKEYEAGLMAFRDLDDALALIDARMRSPSDVSREVEAVDALWSRIKAALASEVTP